MDVSPPTNRISARLEDVEWACESVSLPSPNDIPQYYHVPWKNWKALAIKRWLGLGVVVIVIIVDDAGGEVKGSTCLESSFSWRD